MSEERLNDAKRLRKMARYIREHGFSPAYREPAERPLCHALNAAIATLRKVQACRELAERQIADGITVAADIEGLIP